jgi:translation initiation factor 5A
MRTDGSSKDDVKIPEGQIGDDIEKAFETGNEVTVTIIAAMGKSPTNMFSFRAIWSAD